MNVRELIDKLQKLVRERPKVEGLPVFIGPADELEVIEHEPGKAVYLYRASPEFAALPLRSRCWRWLKGDK
jgi:hypothetical protein